MKQLEFPFTMQGALDLYNQHERVHLRNAYNDYVKYANTPMSLRQFSNHWVHEGHASTFATIWRNYYFTKAVEHQTEKAKEAFETNNITLDKLIVGKTQWQAQSPTYKILLQHQLPLQ